MIKESASLDTNLLFDLIRRDLIKDQDHFGYDGKDYVRILRIIKSSYQNSSLYKSGASTMETGRRRQVSDSSLPSEIKLKPGRVPNLEYFIILQIVLLLETDNHVRLLLRDYLKKIERRVDPYNKHTVLSTLERTEEILFFRKENYTTEVVIIRNLLQRLISRKGSPAAVIGILKQSYSRALNRLRVVLHNPPRVVTPVRKRGYADKGSAPMNPAEANARKQAARSVGPNEQRLREIVEVIQDIQRDRVAHDLFGTQSQLESELRGRLNEIATILTINPELSAMLPWDPVEFFELD